VTSRQETERSLGTQPPSGDDAWRALHAAAVDAFDAVVRQVRDDHWTLPTPCAGWDVRALVEHVVSEACWTPPLLAGLTIAEVGERFEGDLIGSDPAAAWAAARDGATTAADAAGLAQRTVHLSSGDAPASEYLRQLTADYLVHSWDLAVAIGADDRLPAELVATVAEWFAGQATAYRGAGAVAAAIPTRETDDAQHRLLAQFGRDPDRCTALAAVARFDAAFGRQDVAAVLAAMTDDCVFESTAPPDGVRYRGRDAVRDAWTEFFAGSHAARFETEEQFACADRVVSRWRYEWPGGHVRGVDVFRVRDGRVAEKLSYVKG
jgi:uncharacterized protein (TIGR03086 family)